MIPRKTTILCLTLCVFFAGVVFFSFMETITDAKATTIDNAYADTQAMETVQSAPELDEYMPESSDESDTMPLDESDAISSDDDENVLVMNVPIDKFIRAPEDISAKKPPVDFPHSRHFHYTCQTCHHTWEGDENIKSCTASGCHDQVNRPKSTDGKEPDPKQEIAYFKTAYHQLCVTCHKDIEKQNLDLELSLKQIKGKLPKAGPTSCVECHSPDNE